MTYNEARNSLPADAKWSSCFGNHGEGGCDEYFRTADGTRYVLSNGRWCDVRPFIWTVTKLVETPRQRQLAEYCRQTEAV